MVYFLLVLTVTVAFIAFGLSLTYALAFFLWNYEVDSQRYGYKDYSLKNQICWYDIQVSAVDEKNIQLFNDRGF